MSANPRISEWRKCDDAPYAVRTLLGMPDGNVIQLSVLGIAHELTREQAFKICDLLESAAHEVFMYEHAKQR